MYKKDRLACPFLFCLNIVGEGLCALPCVKAKAIYAKTVNLPIQFKLIIVKSPGLIYNNTINYQG